LFAKSATTAMPENRQSETRAADNVPGGLHRTFPASEIVQRSAVAFEADLDRTAQPTRMCRTGGTKGAHPYNKGERCSC
jgi:hypothetical protein